MAFPFSRFVPVFLAGFDVCIILRILHESIDIGFVNLIDRISPVGESGESVVDDSCTVWSEFMECYNDNVHGKLLSKSVCCCIDCKCGEK